MHARISHVEGDWFLTDCESSAGTFLVIPDSGTRVDIGDSVRIGKTEIVFLMQPCMQPLGPPTDGDLNSGR